MQIEEDELVVSTVLGRKVEIGHDHVARLKTMRSSDIKTLVK